MTRSILKQFERMVVGLKLSGQSQVTILSRMIQIVEEELQGLRGGAYEEANLDYVMSELIEKWEEFFDGWYNAADRCDMGKE